MPTQQGVAVRRLDRAWPAFLNLPQNETIDRPLRAARVGYAEELRLRKRKLDPVDFPAGAIASLGDRQRSFATACPRHPQWTQSAKSAIS